jgi:hypothetical protein
MSQDEVDSIVRDEEENEREFDRQIFGVDEHVVNIIEKSPLRRTESSLIRG